MAKRFIDSEIWKKQWFRELSPTLKIFWIYICSNCDNCGVWEMDIQLAEFQIGAMITENEILSEFNGNIIKISDKKLFVVDFISFQYGELKEDSVPHRNVFRLLQKHNIRYPIDTLSILYQVVPNTPKDKDKDKDKDKEEEKDIVLKSPQYRISNLLWESIKLSGTTMKEPDFEEWAEEIEKIHRIDKRPWDLINITMQTARQDNFWIKNLKSPKKLRDHLNNGNFDKFIPERYRTDEQYIADLKIALEKENG